MLSQSGVGCMFPASCIACADCMFCMLLRSFNSYSLAIFRESGSNQQSKVWPCEEYTTGTGNYFEMLLRWPTAATGVLDEGQEDAR